MIFDRTLVRFGKNLLYKSLFYIINIIISGSTLISDLYYISFFENKASDIIFGKIPSRIYKDIRNDYVELQFVLINKDIYIYNYIELYI